MQAAELFTLSDHFPFSQHFSLEVAPWEWLPKIKEALDAFDFKAQAAAGLKRKDIPAGVFVGEQVYLHPSVKLPHYAVIEGPAYIGAGTEIRPGAYIRSYVIVGQECVLGNACEFKNCLLFNKVQAPHYNYVGDSILGSKSHLGAGVILANLRLDQKPVQVDTPKGRVDTGLRKLGAILAEGTEVGCNAVLQPGTILGKESVVLSTLAFSGYLEPKMMAKEPKKIQLRVRTDLNP